MSDAIKKYWLGLEQRERLILGVGGVVVALILIYALIWQPWHKSIASMHKSIQPMRSDLVWIRQHAEIIKNGGQTKDSLKGQDQTLLSVIQTTAKRGQVDKAIKQMTPNSDSEVRVVLEDVDFNKWVRWVDQLSLTYGVNIKQVKAERVEKKPNLAEVRLTLVR